MAVRPDCRHYSTRTLAGDEQVQRCRVDAAETTPFGCPEHCLFFEDRPIGLGPWGTDTPR
jgi:hypothetical protein